MKEVSSGNFGIVIAYLLPGFTAVWGASLFSSTLRDWLTISPGNAPTVGGFLYVTLASLGAGLAVSTVRWAVIDTIHHHTGLCRPRWNFARLQSHLGAYDRLEQNHYHYYQWHANMVIAVLFLFCAQRVAAGFWTASFGLADLAYIALVVLFFAGSRDTLRKYYGRVAQILNLPENAPGTAIHSKPARARKSAKATS